MKFNKKFGILILCLYMTLTVNAQATGLYAPAYDAGMNGMVYIVELIMSGLPIEPLPLVIPYFLISHAVLQSGERLSKRQWDF